MPEPIDQFNTEILQKIKSGEVTMHSKNYWTWRAVLWLLGLALLAAAVVFVVSFVIFAMRVSGVSDLPSFGLHGLQEFLAFFPWIFIPAILLFVWLGERFVLHYSFAYRIPVLYSVVALTAVIIAVSLAVVETPLHPWLYESAQQRQLPVAGRVYLHYGTNRPDDFFIGRIVSASGTVFTLQTPDGRLANLVIGESVRFIGGGALEVGDAIEAVGEEQDGSFVASAVRKITGNSPYPIRRPGFK